MKKLIENKRIVIIASAGRTGTKFLADNLSKMVSDSFSVHEPDLLAFNLTDFIRKIKLFGLKYMTIDRLRGKSGIRQFSEQRSFKKLSDEQLIDLIKQARSTYYKSIDSKIIIESYYAWYNLVDLIPKAISNSRVIVITRHPADWVRSNMNWGTQFGDRDFSNKFGFDKINPQLLGDTDYAADWMKMGQFEKLCWLWNFIYGSIQKNLSHIEQIQVYKYEDLLVEKDQEVFNVLLNFITEGTGENFNFNKELLKLKSNVNISYDFPDWEEWTVKQKDFLNKTCSATMRAFNYEPIK